MEGTGYYVLVVDDDTQLRRLFRTALTSWGYEVHAVGTGEEGIEELTRRCPDLLIADLIMPGMSGEELARRSSELCPDTRLVFVSGYGGADLRDFGVTQVVYLPKPISMSAFRETLQRLLAR